MRLFIITFSVIPFIVLILALFSGVFKGTPERKADYQLWLTSDSLYLYDGNRLVGVTPWDDSPLDSVILYDNQ
jgi:hypothetical protein